MTGDKQEFAANPKQIQPEHKAGDSGGRADSFAIAYLSLGSNLGPREQQLRQAVSLLRSHAAIQLGQCSSVYQTKPWGGHPAEQAPFGNLCLKLAIDERALLLANNLAPAKLSGDAAAMHQRCAELLLAYCLHCEQQLGRDRSQQKIRWGQRPIDIDIIDYQRLQCEGPTLTLPHPHFLQRLFVLVPLAEIAENDFAAAYALPQRIFLWQAQQPDWGYKIMRSL